MGGREITGSEVEDDPIGQARTHPSLRTSERAFRAHHRAVLSFLTRRTGDRGVAEELTQQVFLHAVERLDVGARSDDADGALLAWLYTVAHRRFVDDLRGRRRSALRLRQLQTLQPRAETREFGADVAGALKTAIMQLSDAHRAVVVAKLLEDRSFAEIAREAGVGEPAIRMRYSRALAELRDSLRHEGVDP
jgi:RNA polymerase sigma-70 factor (ECF subfamily)